MSCRWDSGTAGALLISRCCHCGDGVVVNVVEFVAGPDGVGIRISSRSTVYVVGADAGVASLQPVKQIKNTAWLSSRERNSKTWFSNRECNNTTWFSCEECNTAKRGLVIGNVTAQRGSVVKSVTQQNVV